MFEQKKLAGALEWLFGLYHEDKLQRALEAYPEEVEGLSAELLARKYSRDAHEVCEYNMVTQIGEDAEYHGEPMLYTKAVCIAEEVESELDTDHFRVEQIWELWLLEDMTFVAIFNTRVFAKTNGEISSAVESRLYMSKVNEEDDLPVSPEALIMNMDDDCMFEQILAERKSGTSEGEAK